MQCAKPGIGRGASDVDGSVAVRQGGGPPEPWRAAARQASRSMASSRVGSQRSGRRPDGCRVGRRRGALELVAHRARLVLDVPVGEDHEHAADEAEAHDEPGHVVWRDVAKGFVAQPRPALAAHVPLPDADAEDGCEYSIYACVVI